MLVMHMLLQAICSSIFSFTQSTGEIIRSKLGDILINFSDSSLFAVAFSFKDIPENIIEEPYWSLQAHDEP